MRISAGAGIAACGLRVGWLGSGRFSLFSGACIKVLVVSRVRVPGSTMTTGLERFVLSTDLLLILRSTGECAVSEGVAWPAKAVSGETKSIVPLDVWTLCLLS